MASTAPTGLAAHGEPSLGRSGPNADSAGELAIAAEPLALAPSPAQGPRAGHRLDHDSRVSGAGGRVRERDVIAASAAHAAPSAHRALADAEFQAIPIAATRRTIAERMMAERRTARPP